MGPQLPDTLEWVGRTMKHGCGLFAHTLCHRTAKAMFLSLGSAYPLLSVTLIWMVAENETNIYLDTA